MSKATHSITTELTQEEIENLIHNLLENNQVFRIPCFAHTIQLSWSKNTGRLRISIFTIIQYCVLRPFVMRIGHAYNSIRRSYG